MHVYCCVCGKEKVNGQWTDKIVPKSEQPVDSTHTYCPEHLVEALEEIRRDDGKPDGD